MIQSQSHRLYSNTTNLAMCKMKDQKRSESYYVCLPHLSATEAFKSESWVDGCLADGWSSASSATCCVVSLCGLYIGM